MLVQIKAIQFRKGSHILHTEVLSRNKMKSTYQAINIGYKSRLARMCIESLALGNGTIKGSVH